MTSYLRDTAGLSDRFAPQAAVLYLWLASYGLEPQITSAWRSPSYQAGLRARWDAGDRAGLVTRPAVSSLHSRTAGGGRPAAEALDMDTRDRMMAGAIARHLGIGWSASDDVHFYRLGAT